MTDLPTKDEIVERLAEALTDDEATHWVSGWRVEYALKVLTVPDLLALLRERGCEVDFSGRTESRAQLFTVVLPEEKPDAVS